MSEVKSADGPLPWFRFYADTISTPAVRKLTDYELRVFLACMSLASQSPGNDRAEGLLTLNPTGEPLDVSFIKAEVWTGKDADLNAALSRLRQGGLLRDRDDGALQVAFRWQQYPSDGSTERVRRSRAKAKSDSPREPDHSLRVSEHNKPDNNTAEQSKAKGNVSCSVSPCGWCGGSGVTDDAPCPTCNGSGEVAA